MKLGELLSGGFGGLLLMLGNGLFNALLSDILEFPYGGHLTAILIIIVIVIYSS